MNKVMYEKSDGKFKRVKVVLEDGYYTLYLNGEEVTCVHENEQNALQSMIDEAEAQLEDEA